MLTPLTKEQVYAHAGKARAAPRTDRRYFYHFRKAVLGFMGVAIGAYVVIQSVIALSAVFHISEYLISFFVVAIGTSLPELVVDLTAIRKRQYVKEATNIALEIANKAPYLIKEPHPKVHILELGESTELELALWISDCSRKHEVLDIINSRLIEEFGKAKIEYND